MFATTLTTQRLSLRPPRREDASAIFERYASDPQVTRWMSWATNSAVEETEEFLRSVIESEEPDREHVWIIRLGDDVLPIGSIGLRPRGCKAEVGYVLARANWGRGLMTEALAAVQREAWRHDSVWRLEALVHPANAASARVLEKAGFRQEGVARRRIVMPQQGDDPQDCVIYAQVRDDLG